MEEMEEERSNELGLSNDDLENIKMVMTDLIDVVATFNGFDEPTEDDWSELKAVLDFANFVVSGIIYSNGIDLCAGHGDDDEDEETVED